MVTAILRMLIVLASCFDFSDDESVKRLATEHPAAGEGAVDVTYPVGSTPTRIEYAVELVVPAVNSTTNAVDP